MGTLDPGAVGVLPLAVGKATRLISFIEGTTKEYTGELVLGVTTDTLDLDGEVLASADATHISHQGIHAVLSEFLGRQDQVPPMYSAIKVQGKKLYEYARAGESVELQARQIDINSINLISLRSDGPRVIATLDISCGKGTYIRSLCRDIGARLGLPACMGALIRTASGPFRLEHSVSLAEFGEQARNYLIPIEDMLRGGTSIYLNYDDALRFLRGQRVQSGEKLTGTCAVFLDTVLLGLGEMVESVLSPKKVLAQEGDIRDNN